MQLALAVSRGTRILFGSSGANERPRLKGRGIQRQCMFVGTPQAAGNVPKEIQTDVAVRLPSSLRGPQARGNPCSLAACSSVPGNWTAAWIAMALRASQ